MRELTRRVDKLVKQHGPTPLGPFRLWFSYDGGRPPVDKPSDEEIAAIEAAGGSVMEIHFVKPEPWPDESLIIKPRGPQLLLPAAE